MVSVSKKKLRKLRKELQEIAVLTSNIQMKIKIEGLRKVIREWIEG